MCYKTGRVRTCDFRNRMKFPSWVKGNREGGKNSYTFYYIYISKLFASFAHHLDNSVGRVSDSRSEDLWLDPRSRHSFSFTYLIFSINSNTTSPKALPHCVLVTCDIRCNNNYAHTAYAREIKYVSGVEKSF